MTVQCHYDVLGISRDADTSTIKKAYRSLALKYHPDKNIITTSDVIDAAQQKQQLEQKFLQVQQAYECLSDIAERKWYDDHRDAILKGWSVSAGTSHNPSSSSSSQTPGTSTSSTNNDIVFNVAPYMYAGCFHGYDDHDTSSFYNVYASVFQQIYRGEVDGCSNLNDVEYLNEPFGNSTSQYENVVVKFYQAWENFSSILSFAWADMWNVQEAEQRRIRRAMEEDNVRARRKARKVRNDEIIALIRFVKRRDPRVIAKKEELENLRLLREHEMKELNKQRKLEKERANKEWREQAEREALVLEEDDRLNGRVRLADLEDNYDYGGNKKKRGKGKKKKNIYDDDNDNNDSNNNPPNEQLNENALDQQHDDVANPEGSIPVLEFERLNVTTANNAIELNVETTNVVPSSDEVGLDVPYSDWRCECCLETFQNKIEMLNHFKSKKHKDMAALRKSVPTDNGTKLKKMKHKSKQKIGQLDNNEDEDEDEDHVVNQSNSKRGTASSIHPVDVNDSNTEDDDDDDDDNDDDDEVVEHQKNNRLFDDEPLYWRCECCQKDFQSEGQMENHMNSKKHKAMYRKYEKEIGKKLLYEVVEEIQQQQK
jgi:DnaJ homolog subfamily A member 5